MKHAKKEKKMLHNYETKRVTHKGHDYWSCCLCGEFFEGFGNNPYPISIKDDDECCDDCNWGKVIPARVKQYTDREQTV